MTVVVVIIGTNHYVGYVSASRTHQVSDDIHSCTIADGDNGAFDICGLCAFS